jgi:hypothetical protein
VSDEDEKDGAGYPAEPEPKPETQEPVEKQALIHKVEIVLLDNVTFVAGEITGFHLKNTTLSLTPETAEILIARGLASRKH